MLTGFCTERCRAIDRAAFAKSIRGAVQYAECIQVLAAYFAHEHLVPVDRLCQIFENIFEIALSSETCADVEEKLFQKLECFERSLKTYLIAAKILYFNETGMRYEKKLYWVHVASSKWAILYTTHLKRDQEQWIWLSQSSQELHEYWLPYFSYEQTLHALCNTQHVFELIFVREQEKEDWAKQMKDLLFLSKQEVEKHGKEEPLLKDILRQLEQSYRQVIRHGLEIHAQLNPLSVVTGDRLKQSNGTFWIVCKKNGVVLCSLYTILPFHLPITKVNEISAW